MKKIILAAAGVWLTVLALAQGTPDSDGDGISDSEDRCPMTKGSKANNGCPEETKPAADNFISAASFEELLTAVCNNAAHRKVISKVENNKSLLTSFSKNGAAQNLPVYYRQSNANNYSVTAVLSNRLADTTAVLNSINRLFRQQAVCNGLFSEVELTYTPAAKRYSDVYASDEGGVFFFVETEKKGSGYNVQFRVSRVIYANATVKKAPEKTTPPPVNECGDFEAILNDCINGYNKTKGNLVKEQTPAKYYATTLPALGLADKYVVESINLDFTDDGFDRKKVIYYNAEKKFDNTADAVTAYEQLKNRLKKCYSGRANVSDEKNQKIYELFLTYKGYTIRAAVIFVSFFGSNVSISFRIADQ